MVERPLIHETQDLRRLLVQMAGYVEDMLERCVIAISKGDISVLEGMDELERKVNEAEVESDQKAIKIMALYAPEASDLRFIAMAIKINNDLERVGDHAHNIRNRILEILERSSKGMPADVVAMGTLVRHRLKTAINAFVDKDPQQGRIILKSDDEVDQIRDRIFSALIANMSRENAPLSVSIMMLSKDLERIGDLASNICEDVVYICEGEILKHSSRDAAPPAP